MHIISKETSTLIEDAIKSSSLLTLFYTKTLNQIITQIFLYLVHNAKRHYNLMHYVDELIKHKLSPPQLASNLNQICQHLTILHFSFHQTFQSRKKYLFNLYLKYIKIRSK